MIIDGVVPTFVEFPKFISAEWRKMQSTDCPCSTNLFL
jgi:hypothetical protein